MTDREQVIDHLLVTLSCTVDTAEMNIILIFRVLSNYFRLLFNMTSVHFKTIKVSVIVIISATRLTSRIYLPSFCQFGMEHVKCKNCSCSRSPSEMLFFLFNVVKR